MQISYRHARDLILGRAFGKATRGKKLLKCHMTASAQLNIEETPQSTEGSWTVGNSSRSRKECHKPAISQKTRSIERYAMPRIL